MINKVPPQYIDNIFIIEYFSQKLLHWLLLLILVASDIRDLLAIMTLQF